MNKREALRQFCDDVLPGLDARYGKDDRDARLMAWNDYADALCKSGQITQRQFNTWASPFG